MRIVTLVLLAANAFAVVANALLLFGGAPADLLDWSVALLAVPVAAGVVGVARRRRWGRALSVPALAVEIVLFSVHARRQWGHLHGGEWLLAAWIALAAVALLSVLVTRADT